MNYPSIRIEGAILSSDIFERIEEAPGQRAVDFNLDPTTKVKDEIARAWADAQDYWRIFHRKLDTLKPDSPATTETRQQWMTPLLGLLGYQLDYQPKGTELNGKIYNISHRASNRAQTPVQIVGYREPAGLDRKPANATLRMSAHALVQEYLNLNEQLYGLATNGRVLRLLRNSSRLIKLSYLEFDLDRIFTDGLFADFAILYRLLHASRLPITNATAAESAIERYHQDTIEQGTRIREGLRTAVTEALEILGTGFIADPANSALRGQLDAGTLAHSTFFSCLLRIVYRLLFLNVVEDRGLIFTKEAPATKLRTYFDFYSVQRLRRLARTRGLKTERHCDAWLSLLSTFQIFENPAQATKLGTTAFGGQLFDPASLGPLGGCRLSNASLLHAIDRLCSFDDPKTKQRLPVNFGALATEEFGSVYESLLELHPVIETSDSPRFSFKQTAGNDRRTSGSYYTPASLVDCLLDTALEPVLKNHLRNFKALGFPNSEAAILSLKVCDPACGSGHFLIAAAQRIARRLALVRAGDDEPAPDQVRHALRQVISHCIYAMDINPMSVELCRVALWLEAVEPGKPLSFLDHHIRVGNSLIGATPELIAAGLPDEAFNAIEGDDKKACAVLKKRNKAERGGLGPLFVQQSTETQACLQQAAAALEELPDDRPEDIHAKEVAFRQREQTEEYRQKKRLADTWCAAFFIRKHFLEKDRAASANGITQAHLNELASGRPLPVDLGTAVDLLAVQYQFSHWHLEFPAVFGADSKGGFDVVLGNPPWEHTELKEKEWFAECRPDIANAPTGAKRKALIEKLRAEDPSLWEAFISAVRDHDASSHFLGDSGHYPLCGRGRINLYAVFAEGMRNLLGPAGRLGCVLPTGIATDDTTKFFFQDVVEKKSLVSLYDFENKLLIFPAVAPVVKFCLFTSGRGIRPTSDVAEFVFFAHTIDHLRDDYRRFRLSNDEIVLLNPNTRTCPIFRSQRDAELTKAIHRRVPVLIREAQHEQPEVNPWGITFKQGLFNMTSDSELFRTQEQLVAENWKLEGNTFHKAGGAYFPLYEAKLFHQFNHRPGTFEGIAEADRFKVKAPTRALTVEELADPHFLMVPRYWVAREQVNAAAGTSSGWHLAFRDMTNVMTNSRNAVFSILPFVAVGHSAPLVILNDRQNAVSLYSNVNSFIFDYTTRQNLAGGHLTYFILKQLPVPSPELFSSSAPWESGSTIREWLTPRVLELTYTAWDLESFAQDFGHSGPPFRWIEDRRFQLRCELDAALFHIYLPSDINGDWLRTERETEENLARLKADFPTPRHAVSYIMDTFPMVKRKDEEKFGNYRTRETILVLYDSMAQAIRTNKSYQSHLNPKAADLSCCHPARAKTKVAS